MNTDDHDLIRGPVVDLSDLIRGICERLDINYSATRGIHLTPARATASVYVTDDDGHIRLDDEGRGLSVNITWRIIT